MCCACIRAASTHSRVSTPGNRRSVFCRARKKGGQGSAVSQTAPQPRPSFNVLLIPYTEMCFWGSLPRRVRRFAAACSGLISQGSAKGFESPAADSLVHVFLISSASPWKKDDVPFCCMMKERSSIQPGLRLKRVGTIRHGCIVFAFSSPNCGRRRRCTSQRLSAVISGGSKPKPRRLFFPTRVVPRLSAELATLSLALSYVTVRDAAAAPARCLCCLVPPPTQLARRRLSQAAAAQELAEAPVIEAVDLSLLPAARRHRGSGLRSRRRWHGLHVVVAGGSPEDAIRVPGDRHGVAVQRRPRSRVVTCSNDRVELRQPRV